MSSSSEYLLYDVQSLLRVYGIHSKVRFGEVNTRKGRFQGTLSILGEDNLISFMKSIGFKLSPQKEKKFNEVFTHASYSFAIEGSDYFEIKSIQYYGKEKVYDLNVPNAHHFIANGVVVHNCNLASIALPKYVTNETFDYQKLYEVAKVVTYNLNKIIDRNYYPIPEAKKSNLRHRPIGIGVQGLADVFMLLNLPFESDQASQINKNIFETIYFAAVESSMEMAKKEGVYETFEGSPASKGIFQFDLWNVKPSKRWNWDGLKENVKKYGMRNSLLLAPMPTASTSQILGNNECFEPYTSNIYSRRVLSGEFIVVNKHLLKSLIDLGIWNENLKNQIIMDNGSVQNILNIPDDLKAIYKTAWEISQKKIIDMSADRGAFICQSQSLNLFMKQPTSAKLTSMHFYAWKKGLKTGMYYLRSNSAANAIKFSIDADKVKDNIKKQALESKIAISTQENTVCTLNYDGDDCEVCSG